MKKIEKLFDSYKGLVIFYLCMSIFATIWVSKVESNNDEMMLQKNSYILSDNL